MTGDLGGRIRAVLADTHTPLWVPGLISDLTDEGWKKLYLMSGLTRSSYSTSRVLSGNICAIRDVVTHIPNRPTPDDGIPIELLPSAFARRYERDGIRFYEAREILDTPVQYCLEEAFDVLTRIPTLMPSLHALVGAIHLIANEDDDFDVSFSDPHLPFSVFVSVPQGRGPCDALRVAEAIVHEAMHLELSLLEEVVPLVNGSEGRFLSPWRGEYRSTQGVLHALFVFRAIDSVLREISYGALPQEWHRHVRERCEQIAGQMQEITDFRWCEELTPDGSVFVKRLLG